MISGSKQAGVSPDTGGEYAALEGGWQQFTLGSLVEVKTGEGTGPEAWRPGVVVSTPYQDDRALTVDCLTQWHGNNDFLQGRGATIMVYGQSTETILGQIRRPGIEA